MMAVCGMGSPKGRLKSAVTAYQSARAPTIAASANARSHPMEGWTGSAMTAMAKSRAMRNRRPLAKVRTRNSEPDTNDPVWTGVLITRLLEVFDDSNEGNMVNGFGDKFIAVWHKNAALIY